LNAGISAHGDLIDNGYTGWGGTAQIDWPEWGVRLQAHMPHFAQDGGAEQHYCLIYRPPQGSAFCFEPITQPIDAFHLPGQPGLRVLAQGEALRLSVQWRFGPLTAA
jgi:aldose 1-epimerase